MATIGLRDLYRAPITTGSDGKETYGTPVKMAIMKYYLKQG